MKEMDLKQDRIPPHIYFVGAAIFHYLGPSFAVLLFAKMSVEEVAWLRIVSAAAIFAVWRRPWKCFFASEKKTRWLIVAFGFTVALMNYSFYNAISEISLGTVAAIEFIGPVILALVGIHSLRNFIALLLTGVGVWLLTNFTTSGTTIGFIWAFANAILFTLYIIIANKLAKSDSKTSSIDRLGAAMLFAALLILPAGYNITSGLNNTSIIGAGIGVGVSSSVIPYILDQLAMRKLSVATYSLFVALLPATAVVMGAVVLHQIPSSMETVAVLLIVLGVVLARRQ